MNKKVIIYIVSIVILIACKTPILEIKYSNKISLEKLDYHEKEVLIIPMNHIGEESYFSDISKKIDSLKSEGFKVYYESTANPIDLDSTINDHSLRKLRKISGWNISNRYDSKTGIFQNGVQLVNQNKLKLQMNQELGINELDKKVDIPIYKLISLFEQKYGVIKLAKCDYNTELSSFKYKCPKVKKELTEKFKNEFILNLRNEKLVNEIKTSSDSKILVAYGAGHLKGIKELIKKIKSSTHNKDVSQCITLW